MMFGITIYPVNTIVPTSRRTACALEPSGSLLLVPHAHGILHPNLIPQQHLRPSRTLPAAIARGREHEATTRIDVNGRDHAAAVAGHDGKGNGTVAGR